MSEKEKRVLAAGRFPSRADLEGAKQKVAERAPSPNGHDEALDAEERPTSTRRFVSENLWRTASAAGSPRQATRTAVKDAPEKPSSAKEKILRALKKLHPME